MVVVVDRKWMIANTHLRRDKNNHTHTHTPQIRNVAVYVVHLIKYKNAYQVLVNTAPLLLIESSNLRLLCFSNYYSVIGNKLLIILHLCSLRYKYFSFAKYV